MTLALVYETAFTQEKKLRRLVSLIRKKREKNKQLLYAIKETKRT